jgi:hypothetical protein
MTRCQVAQSHCDLFVVSSGALAVEREERVPGDSLSEELLCGVHAAIRTQQ